MRTFMIVALLPLAACQSNWETGEPVEASGSGSRRDFAATDFTGVALRGPDDVDVKIGTNFSVAAEGDPKALDRLDIRVVDGTLDVGRQNDRRFDNDRGVRVHVVLPRLVNASVGGAGDLTVERAEGDFKGEVAGSGDLTIADLRAGDATLSVAGSGDMRLSGRASKLSVSIAGSGSLEARGLTAKSADVAIAGSGNVAATVEGPASVSIVGSGDAELGGGAKCSVNAVGSGEAHCS